jgi:two-component system response regulator DevR
MNSSHIHSPLRIYLVEDSALIRQRLTMLLGNLAGVEVVGWAEDPHSALTGIAATQADLLVIDLMLVRGSGLTVLRELSAKPHAPVSIVLTNYAIAEFRHESILAGAHYFFDKTNEFNLVLDTVQTLADRRISHAAVGPSPITAEDAH